LPGKALSRFYPHRVAIPDHRLVDVTDERGSGDSSMSKASPKI
jgi:hypothetical protein